MAKTIKSIKAGNIDEYIAGFPKHIQEILEAIRAAIKKAAPEAGETVKYDLPTFTLKGNLVSFGAWKNHIGFYPAPRGVEEFRKELSVYKGAKSTVQFPIDKPIPLTLIGKMVKFRVKKILEKLEKTETKIKKKKYYP
jgi:uncharacterized protein YdhG (YjbR/CyaY superfamily)